MKPKKPFVLYDGECDFCCRWAKWAAKKLGKKISFIPWQEAPEPFSEMPRKELENSIQYIAADGTRMQGAQAIFYVLSLKDRPGKILRWSYNHLPGFAKITEMGYRIIARNRSCLSKQKGNDRI